MAATPKKRTPAVKTTITKSEALAQVKAGELNTNKYRRPCIVCEEIVPAGEGVLGGNKTEGWWASHKIVRGKCVGVSESTTEAATADKVDETPNVPVRGKKRSNTMAAAKKTVARRRTVKPTNTETAAAPKKSAPVKRTTTRKAAPTKPAPVVENESASDDDFAALGKSVQDLVNSIAEQIKMGNLDAALGVLDDAITDRLDAMAPAPKTPAKRATTTTAKSKAEKLAPVTRSKGSGSASATAPKPVPVRPRKGYDYEIKSTLKTKMAGQHVTFKSYVADTENKKASCTLVNDFDGKPAGTRITVPTSSLTKITE